MAPNDNKRGGLSQPGKTPLINVPGLASAPRVRAKFKVERNTPRGDSADISLRAVTSGSPENEQFFSYTPSGQVTLVVKNPGASDQFVEGKEFYVDFTPAE